MMLELMLAPVLHPMVGGARVMTVLTLLVALSAIGVRVDTLVLFVPALIAELLASHWHTGWAVPAAVFRLVFLCYVLALVLWRVLRDRTVTLDTVAGSACAYMLIGALWGELYVLTEHWRPSSFEIPSGLMGGNDLQIALAYFSYQTLTSVTYGDIRPTTAAVGGLCLAEAITGQLYLAIMIARLVGIHTAQRTG